MISDIFDRKHRATALSIYSVGIYIGILTGFMLGGWITEFFGWRLAFFVVGLPGVALAVVLRLTVREPLRGWSEGQAHRVSPAAPMLDVIRLLWSRRSFRHISLAASLQALIIYGIGNWLPSYFLRTHDISIGELGTWMALTTGIGGGLGSFFGGWVADRLGARDCRWYLWAPALMVGATAPLLLLMLTTDSLYPALLLVGPFNFLVAAYLGAVLAVSHNLVETRMRALTSAILFFMINLIGMGIGPVSVGALSDHLTSTGAAAPLGTAMLAVGITAAIWACLHYYFATRHLREELALAQVAGSRS
jgi:MFS family permease